MSTSTSTAILVAGMHRSGTSAVTGALSHFGIALGKKLLEPGDDNPKGYWENERAVSIHEALLHGLQRHWSDVRPLPTDWRESAVARHAENEVRALVDEEFADAPLWAVKDPRICWFLPLWLDVLKERGIRPKVLMVARRPSEVAASIHARNGWSPVVGRMLWMNHVMSAENASRGIARTAITYDQLLSDPNAAIGSALSRLDVGVATTNQVHGLSDFVDIGIRHFRHDAMADVSCNPLVALADAVYEAVDAISSGTGDWSRFRDLEADFAAWHAEHGEYVNGLADMAIASELRLHDELIRSYDLQSALNAQIAWSESAVKKHGEVAAERDWLNQQMKALEVTSNEQMRVQDEALREQMKAQEDALREQMKTQEDALREQMKAQEDASIERVRALETESAERLGVIEAHALRIEHMSSEIDLMHQAKLEAERDILVLRQTQVADAEKIDALEKELSLKTLNESALSEALSAERQAHRSTRDIADALELERRSLSELRDRQTARIAALEATIHQMETSRSWRLTRPLRAIAHRFRSDKRAIDDER